MTDKSHKPRLILRDGVPRATSVAIAAYLDRDHADVVATIRRVVDDLDDDGFAKRNIVLVVRNNAFGHDHPLPYYEMTRDGFFLVAGELAAGDEGILALCRRYMLAFMDVERRARSASPLKSPSFRRPAEARFVMPDSNTLQ